MKIAPCLVLVVIALIVVASDPAFADGQDSRIPSMERRTRLSARCSNTSYRSTRTHHPSRPGSRPTKAFVRGQYGGSGPAATSAPAKTDSAPTNDRVRFDDSGNVEVYIHLENSDDSTLQQLRDMGATIEVVNSDWNVLQAWVPISALDQIANLDAVQEITPPDYGVTKTGSIKTKGDAIQRTDLARAFSGLTGAGVKVGVISAGATSWRTALGSGDLPNMLETDLSLQGRGHEGTAMLEIIDDLAPDAELAFAGGGSSLRFVEAVLWLAIDAFQGEGVEAIVDDVVFFGEPYFEDGPVALAAADAVAGGVVFVSAAGNSAEEHYEGHFVDGGDGFHAFDGDSDISMRVDTGLDVFVHLQVNDPFGASGNDYDLFICPAGLKPIKFNLQNDLCAGSDRLQDGNDDPDEAAFLFHPGEADIYIRKNSGDPKRLEMFIDGAEIREHGVSEGGIFGHPAASEVLAVGAIDATDPGHDDPEYFSDKGPSIISHPTPESRNKPDVMGIDGVLVTGSGNFGRPFPDGPGNLLFGTSAAAPHLAAIAALVIEAQRLADPSITQK